MICISEFTKKLKGLCFKKDVGEVASGGFSSKVSFLSHLLEETKIRPKITNYFNDNFNFFNSLVKYYQIIKTYKYLILNR